MIGVVGPRDSLELVRTVAGTTADGGRVVYRSYEQPEDAVRIARDLQNASDVILFTGRLPYSLALSDSNTQWSAELRYMPHTSADLFRTICLVAISAGGAVPRVSLDVFGRGLADETFQEIELPAVESLFSFEGLSDTEIPDSEKIADFHEEAWRSGRASVSLTCLGVVHDELRRRGVPSWRVEHTRGSIRHSLEEARLVSDLRASQANSIAVAILRMPPMVDDIKERYELEIQELRRQEVSMRAARYLRGQLFRFAPQEAVITTSRGVVESAFNRIRAGQRSVLEIEGAPPGTQLGFGIDMTFTSAEANARKALELTGNRDIVSAVFPGGTVWMSDEQQDVTTLETNPAWRDLSSTAGMGSLAISRMVNALRRLDPNAITARQLAEVYGVKPRSARRMLNGLVNAGFARETGTMSSAGAGRPQTVFAIDVQAIVDAGSPQ